MYGSRVEKQKNAWPVIDKIVSLNPPELTVAGNQLVDAIWLEALIHFISMFILPNKCYYNDVKSNITYVPS